MNLICQGVCVNWEKHCSKKVVDWWINVNSLPVFQHFMCQKSAWAGQWYLSFIVKPLHFEPVCFWTGVRRKFIKVSLSAAFIYVTDVHSSAHPVSVLLIIYHTRAHMSWLFCCSWWMPLHVMSHCSRLRSSCLIFFSCHVTLILIAISALSLSLCLSMEYDVKEKHV